MEAIGSEARGNAMEGTEAVMAAGLRDRYRADAVVLGAKAIEAYADLHPEKPELAKLADTSAMKAMVYLVRLKRDMETRDFIADEAQDCIDCRLRNGKQMCGGNKGKCYYNSWDQICHSIGFELGEEALRAFKSYCEEVYAGVLSEMRSSEQSN